MKLSVVYPPFPISYEHTKEHKSLQRFLDFLWFPFIIKIKYSLLQSASYESND